MVAKRLLKLVLLVVVAAATVFLYGCGKGSKEPAAQSGGEPQKPVELKLVSYFPLNSEKEWIATNYFKNKVESELGGKVRINVLGGPEVVQSADQPEALRAGTIDLNFIPGSYYTSLVPEIDALKLSEFSPMDMRKNGAFDFFDKMLQEKANAKLLGLMLPGNEWFYIYSNKKINKADLSGMLIRTIPIYDPIIKALGAKTVSLPASEVPTAMERKVIDGFCYPTLGADDLNYHEVAKFVLDHGFLSGEAVLVMNFDSWKKLPKDIQEAIARIAAEAEEYGWNKLKEAKQTSINNLKAKGVEFVKLPPAEEEKFNKVVSEASWAEIKKKTPQNYEQLRQLLVKH